VVGDVPGGDVSDLAAAPVSRLGDRGIRVAEEVGEFAFLSLAALAALGRPRFPWRELLLQFEALAVRSAPLVVITSTFTGMVLALQTAYSLTRFGAKPYVGSIVGLAIVRELGPVLAALMVGGRAGAGIASELGSMQVTEQVDAIRAMGADPVQKLVLPRVFATTVGLPLLTIFAIVLGIAGGMVVAEAQFGIDSGFYLQTVTNVARVSDFASGVAKTLVFGWAIGMVGCHVGLATQGGTVGVGRATTRAVVMASIVVLIADFFLTKLLLLLPTDALVGAFARLLGTA
jgi:phospholipid/cholesterol/gamma-HCH transport system permease protein